MIKFSIKESFQRQFCSRTTDYLDLNSVSSIVMRKVNIYKRCTQLSAHVRKLHVERWRHACASAVRSNMHELAPPSPPLGSPYLDRIHTKMSDTEPLLTIVCCHSVFHGTDPFEEDNWSLAPFQRASGSKPAENLTFLAHIKQALVTVLHSNFKSTSFIGPRSVVVFSGGYTNAQVPQYSEAAGYLQAARHMIEHDDEFAQLRSLPVESWAALEEHATDSYQNILFSILRYEEVCGTYPHRIVVVTHAFKADRMKMHAEAISWQREFDIQGIDPPFEGTLSIDSAA
jgi:hypothetical protein